MSDQVWGWALSLVGVAGFWLAGRRVWWAWHVNLANQALWLAFAVTTRQWGFLVGVAVYTAVFTGNARRWTAERRRANLTHTRRP